MQEEVVRVWVVLGDSVVHVRNLGAAGKNGQGSSDTTKARLLSCSRDSGAAVGYCAFDKTSGR